MAQEKVFFMHIPKTAGTSLRYLLEREYRVALGAFYPPRVPSILPVDDTHTAVTGHFRFGFHGAYSPRYCTFLREPLAQVISHFRHIQSSSNPDHAHLKGFDLVQFSNHPFAANIQTKYILGVPDSVALTAADGLQAFERLRSEFLGYGLQERFDESILLLGAALHWKRPFYLHINASRGEKVAPSAEELMAIGQNNAADMALYSAATALFEERWKALPNASIRLRLYRTMNAIYTRLNPLILWIKQMAGKS